MLTSPCYEHPGKLQFRCEKVVFAGVYIIFHILDKKHRFWVLIKMASLRQFLRVPTIYIWSKNRGNIISYQLVNVISKSMKYYIILYRQVNIM